MNIKVCGMKYPGNIKELSLLSPDYMGFIFYKSSKRFVENLNPEIVLSLPDKIKKVGVFVNEKPGEIERIIQLFRLQVIQFHGDESPGVCQYFQKKGLEVIKAISISSREDLKRSEDYSHCCDYLLFDTKTPLYGGSGKQYDWKILEDYNGSVPFFLSGGIGPEDLSRITSFYHPLLFGIDLNSKFEKEDFSKDISQLECFISQLRK